ncbi:hypothetical protein [Thiohalomonas denitrificans]|uniref:Uncharacterized protein n=1 Tax=Thiohalomonas denitrificans TaxID=415747 RepID=A0A1G5PTS4_9GAMM|nr:hypothetical protein [Thiohalomonas denitrificans]SCZ52974.1 hypothetical protein SAMN03097708_00842 [Thiohalomonas denitrificans]
MENIIKAKVLGARRGKMDGGVKYASIYIIEDVMNEDDKKGALPMKMNCEYGLLDHLDAEHLPAEMELQVKLDMGAGGKAAMYVQAVRPVEKGNGAGARTTSAPGSNKTGTEK